MEEDCETIEQEEAADDYTDQEDAELWRMRQKTLKRGSTLIRSEDELEKDDNVTPDILLGKLCEKFGKKKEDKYFDRKSSFASKKQQSLCFDLSGTSSSSHRHVTSKPMRPSFLSEEESYKSLSALDQLTLFQKLQDLESGDVLPLPSPQSDRSDSTNRPKTTGRLARTGNKGRMSWAIFGQGSLDQGE